jgi:hypothetical protein
MFSFDCIFMLRNVIRAKFRKIPDVEFSLKLILHLRYAEYFSLLNNRCRHPDAKHQHRYFMNYFQIVQQT